MNDCNLKTITACRDFTCPGTLPQIFFVSESRKDFMRALSFKPHRTDDRG